MISWFSPAGDIVFTGGVVQKPCMASFLNEKLGRRGFILKNPQFIGVFEAVLLASELENILIE